MRSSVGQSSKEGGDSKIPMTVQQFTLYNSCMKPITINVSLPVYQQYKIFAKKRGRKVSELIREAMDQYLRDRIENRPSLKDLTPLPLTPLSGVSLFPDDTLAEMLGEND